ncbi:MAG: hypothetical protein GF307_01810 [candidate division Zixibacteria bacterium]|nr:hypothetical protein [candidate division Zixibacteria bacterium]
MLLDILVILAIATGAVLLIMIALRLFYPTEDPDILISQWVKRTSKKIGYRAKEKGVESLKAVKKPITGLVAGDKVKKSKRLCRVRFFFEHPDIDRERFTVLRLSDSALEIFDWSGRKKLADIPLKMVEQVFIEKSDTARERFSKAGYPLSGVYDDFLDSKPKKREYIISISWKDDRRVNHDSVFQYRSYLGFFTWSNPWEKLSNIRNKILWAKEPVKSPEFIPARLSVENKTSDSQVEIKLDESGNRIKGKLEPVKKSEDNSNDDGLV